MHSHTFSYNQPKWSTQNRPEKTHFYLILYMKWLLLCYWHYLNSETGWDFLIAQVLPFFMCSASTYTIADKPLPDGFSVDSFFYCRSLRNHRNRTQKRCTRCKAGFFVVVYVHCTYVHNMLYVFTIYMNTMRNGSELVLESMWIDGFSTQRRTQIKHLKCL